MSSFMMSNQSLSAVGKAVEDLQKERGWDYGLGSGAEAIAKKLYDLNAAGVRARYEDADKADMIPSFYFINHQLPLGEIQFIKSLQCLRYQASEGEVNQTEGFKKLESLIQVVAEKIVRGLPAYERAKWD